MEHSHDDQHTAGATDEHAADLDEHQTDHDEQDRTPAEHATAALAGHGEVVKVQPDGGVPTLPQADTPAGDQPPAGPGADLFDTWQQADDDGAH